MNRGLSSFHQKKIDNVLLEATVLSVITDIEDPIQQEEIIKRFFRETEEKKMSIFEFFLIFYFLDYLIIWRFFKNLSLTMLSC